MARPRPPLVIFSRRNEDWIRRSAASRASQPNHPHPMDDEQQQPPQTIRITLDENVAQGEYVNFANIIHSPAEFIIDLGRIVPGRTDVKIFSRVIMTPLHAKQLMQALGQNVALFESKFGEIRVEGAPQYAVDEPSN